MPHSSFAAVSQAPLLAGSLCSRHPSGLTDVVEHGPYLGPCPAPHLLPALPEPLLTPSSSGSLPQILQSDVVSASRPLSLTLLLATRALLGFEVS